MSAKIQHRRGTSAQWASAVAPNGQLSAGEIGLDTDLNQIKIGPSGGPTSWGSVPWLGGTLPYFASPSSNDLNNSANMIAGRYRWASPTGLTNVPSAPINLVTADGGINMVVMVFGTTVIQQLWTDGDGGTQVPKSYSRVYDGDVTTWRPWAPQNLWGISATEGVDVFVRDLIVRRNATVEGDLSINGNTNIGNAATDIAVFQAGSASAPSQTFAGDTNTGAYSPAADKYAVATAGVQRVLVEDSLTTIKNAFQIDGNFKLVGNLVDVFNCNSQRLTNIGTPSTATEAMRLDDLVALSRLSMVYGTSGTVTGSDGTIGWTIAGTGTTTMTATDAGGRKWRGIAAVLSGGGNILAVQVKTSDTSQFSVTASSSVTGILVIAYQKQ